MNKKTINYVHLVTPSRLFRDITEFPSLIDNPEKVSCLVLGAYLTFLAKVNYLF
ncbi:hypothetical protein Q4502_03410 [Mesomycoplasma ovipneumoniae]|uniref:hypothetical protein n=1 Tax=Mesomycoplasma ovipneumoniae TaxID=29562 RepID=UPI0026E42E38|nr:hypothetical protein [Mesomycoplasma ovipneumoniae]MDO6856743.1 hypothetical protein [Mesomycoplasma ovipneumoniae]